MNDEQGPVPLHERGARMVAREAKELAVGEAKSYLFWKLFVPVLGLLWTWLTVNPPNNGYNNGPQKVAYVCAAKASLRSIQTTNKSKCAPGFDIVTVRK